MLRIVLVFAAEKFGELGIARLHLLACRSAMVRQVKAALVKEGTAPVKAARGTEGVTFPGKSPKPALVPLRPPPPVPV